MIVEYKGMKPDVEKAAFIADNAAICGDVHLAEDTSIWFSASLRAEVSAINIGKGSNVQDNCVLHADYDLPINIGEYVTVGHNAIIHGCTLEDKALIGMGAIIMNGAVIGEGSIVAAGAVVKEHTIIPPYSLVAGVPAVIKKTLTPGQRPQENNGEIYVRDALAYAHESKIVG